MKKLLSLFLLISIVSLSILPGETRPLKKFSQLEIRQIQTHTYPTNKDKEVFKAVINTFQDNGFTIINIEDDLGYIRAKKEFKNHRTDKSRMANYIIMFGFGIASTVLSYGAAAYTLIDPVSRMGNELAEKTIIVDANANIEKFGKQTRVRVTMIEKVLENADGYSFVKSSPRAVTRIYEPKLYQAFFNEIDKSIFYEKI